MKMIEGGICAVPGVKAAGARRGKYGLALISGSGVAAGMYTTNKIRAAPLELTASNLEGGRLDGIIANSGCANCYNGPQGLEDAKAMAGLMADFLRTEKERIAVASTGVIGRHMDMGIIDELFLEASKKLRSGPEASQEAAKAIMTTDTKVKEIAVEHEGIKMGGIVKGSGMIAPNMATMLCFIYTDANLPQPVLRQCLADAVADSFNMLTVDGDTSTNDTVLLTATGAKSCSAEAFKEALKYVCMELARKMARDGEGATKYFETVVSGARSEEDARSAAMTVANSSLVKTAIYGADPNWGRVIAAVGRSGASVDPAIITLGIEHLYDCLDHSDKNDNLVDSGSSSSKLILVDKGRIVEGVLDKAKEIMKGDSILVSVDLGLGKASARSFGCDLTYDYVKINAEYTT